MSKEDDIYRVPCDFKAEEAFVGEVLATEGRALTELPDVIGELCHHWTFRFILETCLTMHAERQPVTFMSVTQRVLASGEKWLGIDGSWGAEISRLFREASGKVVGAADYYLTTLKEQLALRRIHSAALFAAKQANQPQADPTRLLSETTARLASCDVVGTENDLKVTLLNELREELRDLNEGKPPKILQTCIAAWNNAFGGLPEGAYIGLGARPGMGKSAMLEQIAFDLLEREIPVSVFMKDMPPKKFLKRLACRAAGVPFWKLAKGYTSKEDRNMIDAMYEALICCHLRLHNPRGLTAQKLCAISRQDIQRYGTQAVFLDHIQVLDLDGKELTAGLTQASIAIRANATETGVPHVVLFHLNRNGAGTTRPTAEDVKQFDQLYGDVDSMALLWSEYKPEDYPREKRLPMKFYYPKDRDGGAGEDEIWFEGSMLSFHATEFYVPDGPASRPVTDADFQ